jgi:hypothetical protein
MHVTVLNHHMHIWPLEAHDGFEPSCYYVTILISNYAT